MKHIAIRVVQNVLTALNMLCCLNQFIHQLRKLLASHRCFPFLLLNLSVPDSVGKPEIQTSTKSGQEHEPNRKHQEHIRVGHVLVLLGFWCRVKSLESFTNLFFQNPSSVQPTHRFAIDHSMQGYAIPIKLITVVFGKS
jgi:hypothetical protein